MRHCLALLMILLPLQAQADCDRWSAGMEEDEGGSVMVARICTRMGEREHELSLRCGAPGDVNLRFIPVVPTGYPPGDGLSYQGDFTFDIDKTTSTHALVFEEMDGAMAGNFGLSGAVITALRDGRTLSIAESTGKVPAVTFTLSGSKPALDKLAGACSKQ
jgi:hypothetical protein